mmetsp:Transcript_99798/g.237871  ORF Transcript_99798/g.237871 Transcript_99798/m.237871 type:complete len:236 (-) Transcript_99798:240-947(-)
MIHVPVIALIREHALQGVDPHGFLGELPVCLGEARRGKLGPGVVQRCAFSLDLVNDICVGQTCRLFQIPHEAVHGIWFDHVDGRQERRHENLRAHHQAPCHKAGLEHLHANEQVHALVLRLLKQGVDPAVVPLQGAQTPEVPEHGSHEARNPCEALEDDESPFHGPDRGVLGFEACHPVEALVKAPHQSMHHLVAEGLGPVLVQIVQSLLDLLLAPDVVQSHRKLGIAVLVGLHQ